jgi:hypothetical protein
MVKNKKNFVKESMKLETFGYYRYPEILTSRVAIGVNEKGFLNIFLIFY